MFGAKFALLLAVSCTAALLGPGESKAVFGIGTRIIGDQLLVKDVLDSRPAGVDEQPYIHFNYAVPEPITYIEILSKENVLADVIFSYHNDIVKGTVTTLRAFAPTTISSSAGIEVSNEPDDGDGQFAATTATTTTTTTSNGPLQIVIAIYGYKETMLNVNPAYILNRDQQFEGVLEPQPQHDDDARVGEESDYDYEVEVEEEEEQVTTASSSGGRAEWDGDAAIEEEEDDGLLTTDNDDDDDDLSNADKLIELGQRQAGDYLIYETSQVSTTHTEEPSNHSIVFYYVDSNLITCVKFIIVDHFVGSKMASHHGYTAPRGDYTHFSPSTLKAIITDYDTTSLFVRMLLYGYRPNEQPPAYRPYLQMSSMQRLKMMLNADTQQPRNRGPLVWHPVTEAALPNATDDDRAATEQRDGHMDASSMVACLEAVAAKRGAGDGTEIGKSGAVAAASASTQLALPMKAWQSGTLKTWWMVALSLLRLLTAQPRV